MNLTNNFLEPGLLVKNPSQPDWGIGQIQSIIENRITVNFENMGKVVLNGNEVTLEEYFDRESQ
ncbi:MAG: DUF3553 domain-containing protein [Rhodobacteraceae bacterium]|nr:DUF3553 domain-containing protein [Paracoccaceae bacterium]MDE2738996.1 DUF3553 domain-containing protein [Paracoccaceae bacterium]MXZ50500.1 DUF3553 domain-containing protein [Paracoccaceae bacterium]MYF47236.1 DUF3553 domain-containing protein [Paracoccaceae bacterium]MYG10817.1 DUF3553 domain-containing protein [Paracoccaceae bacterium]